MADQTYPQFPITAQGLAALHQEAGRLLHEKIEAQVARQQMAEISQKLADQHAPGKCQPILQTVPDDDEADELAEGSG